MGGEAGIDTDEDVGARRALPLQAYTRIVVEDDIAATHRGSDGDTFPLLLDVTHREKYRPTT